MTKYLWTGESAFCQCQCGHHVNRHTTIEIAHHIMQRFDISYRYRCYDCVTCNEFKSNTRGVKDRGTV